MFTTTRATGDGLVLLLLYVFLVLRTSDWRASLMRAGCADSEVQIHAHEAKVAPRVASQAAQRRRWQPGARRRGAAWQQTVRRGSCQRPARRSQMRERWRQRHPHPAGRWRRWRRARACARGRPSKQRQRPQRCQCSSCAHGRTAGIRLCIYLLKMNWLI